MASKEMPVFKRHRSKVAADAVSWLKTVKGGSIRDFAYLYFGWHVKKNDKPNPSAMGLQPEQYQPIIEEIDEWIQAIKDDFRHEEKRRAQVIEQWNIQQKNSKQIAKSKPKKPAKGSSTAKPVRQRSAA